MWPREGSGCILGGGNLNDLDVRTLARRAGAIRLVDLDRDAVSAGLARQGVPPARVVVDAPVDVTGALHLLPLPGASPEGVLRRVSESARRHRLDDSAGGHDVVLSACVLTQLFQSVVESGLDAAETVEAIILLRDHHLRQIVDLLRPGGAAILVTDVVSTATAPELLDRDEAELEGAMQILVAARNFFTGANPYRIMSLLKHDERWARHVAGVEMHGPWLWAVTPHRQHLTCALTFRRAAG